jgi:asparagine synthase (glutamine-hydrolysing)
MCGIAGILRSNLQAEYSVRDQRDIKTMTNALLHRGPDAAGFWCNATQKIHFGHRRLSVIDTSAAADQPMHYGGRYSIIYNGEIYNYIELRSSLRNLGYHFTTASDTEVILAAFAHYGAECLQFFDGMFALAIWDEQENRLFLARDRFGEKPLFFFTDGDRFLFASEMKSLWAVGTPRETDPDYALLFLATGRTSFPLAQERTCYSKISQLAPASYMWLNGGDEGRFSGTPVRYWDIDTRQQFTGTVNEARAALSDHLRKSVAKRLRADLPVGCSLSGGLDSTTIAAMVSVQYTNQLQSFSAVFKGFEKDESAAIDAFTAELGILGRQVSPNAEDLLQQFDQLLWHQEEPIGSASVFAQYRVFELAKAFGITVLLDGQGADEVLAGYPQYIPWFLQEQWRAGKFAAFVLARRAFRKNGQTFSWGIKNYLAALFPQAAQSHLMRRELMHIEQMRFIHPDYIAGFSGEAFLHKPLVTNLNDLLYFDTAMGKLQELLRYADRNSMAFGREVRLPFLQHELVQFIFSLPAEFKMNQGFTKWVLRSSMEKILGPAITWQPRKIAFEPPQLAWMNNGLVKERISAAQKTLVHNGILDKKILQQPVVVTAHNHQILWRYWVLASLHP